MLFKKKKMNNVLKTVAQQNGISVNECRHEMELAIEDARNNPDPEIQAYFIKLFGNRTPTPEEFIDKVAKQAIKER